MTSNANQWKEAKNVGTGYTQDKSLEVFRNIEAFMSKHLEGNKDRVFITRLALRTCLVVASNSLAMECSKKEVEENLCNGLKDFIFGLFNDSILFTNGCDVLTLQKLLVPLFTGNILQTYEQSVYVTIQNWISDLNSSLGRGLILYHSFKRLSLAINLKVFLDVDAKIQPELFEAISDLATTHWHGIISVPLNIKVSFLMSSSYRKAKEAKEKLLKIIGDKILSNKVPFLNYLKQSFRDSNLDLESMKNHVLIFVCALIPKAVGSVLSSAADVAHLWYPQYVNGQGHIEKDDLEGVLMEVLRLWPPFVGNLRVANRDTRVGDYRVPKGNSIFVVSLMAHRDPEVFPSPEKFLPERWKTMNRMDRDKIFSFGNGFRKCPGEQFMLKMLSQVLETFINNFEWDFIYTNRERKVKYLPVTRASPLEEVVLRHPNRNCD